MSLGDSTIMIKRTKWSIMISHRKGFYKSSTLAKPLDKSYMILEIEYIGNQVSLLRNQFNEMGDIVLKKVDFEHLQELLKRKKWIKIWNNYKIPWKSCSYIP